MTQRDQIDENVFILDKTKNIIKGASHKNDIDKVYCSKEHMTRLDEDGYPVLEMDKAEEDYRAAAHKVRAALTERFYVKMNNNGDMFDPTDKTQVYTAERVTNGLPIFQMRLVGKGTFENYIQFLKTSNRKFLTQARLEM